MSENIDISLINSFHSLYYGLDYNEYKMVKRQNFLPALIVALFFWASWFFVAIKISPTSFFSLFSFLFSLFMALFLTLSLLLGNSRRGLLLSLGIIIFLLLRFLKMAHFLNLTLLIGTLISLEFYFKKR